MSAAIRALRGFGGADLPALIDLWAAAWTATGIPIDFDARRAWIGDRLRALRAGGAEIIVGLDASEGLAGFVAIDPRSGYLDQLCIAPAERGSGLAIALIGEAKRRSPASSTSPSTRRTPECGAFTSARDSRLWGGFSPHSGLPTLKMAAGERIAKGALAARSHHAGCHR